MTNSKLKTTLLLTLLTLTGAAAHPSVRRRRQEQDNDDYGELLDNHQDYSEIIGGMMPEFPYPYFGSFGGCGCSLIAPDILLTAAHCKGIANVAHLGSLTVHQGVTRYVDDTITHPDYPLYDPAYDILLVKIHTTALEESYYDDATNQWKTKPTDLSIIPLNSDDNHPAEGAELLVMGFGAVRFGDTQGSQDLQNVVVPAYGRDCASDIADHENFDPNLMLCAGYRQGGKDSCQGKMLCLVGEYGSVW